MLRFIRALGEQIAPDFVPEDFEEMTLPLPVLATPRQVVRLPDSRDAYDGFGVWGKGKRALDTMHAACVQKAHRLTIAANLMLREPALRDLESANPSPTVPPSPPIELFRVSAILP